MERAYDEMAHKGATKSPGRLDCVDCPLCEAPGCFQAAVVRSLETGGANYLPTNWHGFSEYYKCGSSNSMSAGGATAEKLVQFWAHTHPNHLTHTIRSVMDYAKHSEHRKLMEALDKALKGTYQRTCCDNVCISL